MVTQVQVSWVQFRVPSPAVGVPIYAFTPLYGINPCTCGCGCSCCQSLPEGPVRRNAGESRVRYTTGELALSATDLHAGGFGVSWGHTRSFANRLTQNTNVGSGYNWQVLEW